MEIRLLNPYNVQMFEKYVLYKAQTGLPYFDRAAVIAIGSWYYGSALESMRGNQSFLCHLVNIGAIYKP